jgi:hypothetical protein
MEDSALMTSDHPTTEMLDRLMAGTLNDLQVSPLISIRQNLIPLSAREEKAKVARFWRIEDQFLDDREKVGERADRGERWKPGRPGVAAVQSEQDGRLDGGHLETAVKQLCGEPSIGGRSSAQGGLRQADVEREQGMDVGSAAHGLCLRRAAASASLSRRR